MNFVFQVCKEYQRILKPCASLILFFGCLTSDWIAHELKRRKQFNFWLLLPHLRETGFRSYYELGVWLALLHKQMLRRKESLLLQELKLDGPLRAFPGE